MKRQTSGTEVPTHYAVLCAASPQKPKAPWAGAQGAKPDYLYLLQRMCMDNPEAAVGLAKSVARQPGPPIELNTLADVFLQRNMVREATAFLLDVLQGDDPGHDKLQTKARARAQGPGGVRFRV